MKRLFLNILAAWAAIGVVGLMLPREYWWTLPPMTGMACVAHAVWHRWRRS